MIIDNSRRGITLAELMMVTLIIGMLAALAMFSYNTIIKSSRISACMANLRQIDTAITRWSLENNVQPGLPPDENGVYRYISGKKPSCTSGGDYTFEPYGSVPSVRCSKEAEGHKLQR